MYQETSRLAYNEAKQSINDNQQRVLEVIQKLGECNDKQIAGVLGWPINRVTPRRGELVEFGYVEKVGTQKDKVTNRMVNYWKAKPTENESR